MGTFLNLVSSNFLIEYIYGDNDIINTTTAPFNFIENGHTGQPLLLNNDSSGSITGNIRDRSAVEIDSISSRFALLTPNKLGPVYNDFDGQLTNSTSMPLTWTTPEGVKYDTIRIHLIQGFSFNDRFQGIRLGVKVKDKTGKDINLLSASYIKGDSYEIANPLPFLYSGRQYASYVEYKIPSLKYLIDYYKTEWIGQANSDILSYKITNGNGFYNNSLIQIEAATLSTIEKINNQYYTNILQSDVTSISAQDDFSDVGVFIGESTEGDYLEFYGTYNSDIFSDYMQRLNNSGNGKYIAIHHLVITEQLPNTVTEYNLVGNYNPNGTPDLTNSSFLANFNDGDYWQSTGIGTTPFGNVAVGDFLIYDTSLPSTYKIKVVSSTDIDEYSNISSFLRTSDQEFIQDDDFNEKNTFRPVLKYGGSALSFRVDYTLKIFNVNTNATIEKSGSYISFNPQKYGKILLKINTQNNIKVFDVYNKKIIKNFENTNLSNPGTSIQGTELYSKNITSFKQNTNIYSGTKSVSIDENGNIVPKSSPDSKDTVKGQGRATIYISPFDTFVQFNLYEEKDNTIISIDLSKIGETYLNFKNKDGEILKIPTTSNSNVSSVKGQALFRIKPADYNQIINSGNDTFFITTKVGKNTPETVLYSGTYKDYAESIIDRNLNEIIDQQKEQIQSLQQDVQNINNTSSDTISSLQNQLQNLKQSFEQEVQKRVTYILKVKDKDATNDQTIDKKSLKVKSAKFNPYGPTSGPTATGLTSN